MVTKFLGSVIYVKDVHISRDFYENLLNQKVTEDYGSSVVFEGGGFAIWQKDDAYQIIFGSTESDASQPGRLNTELSFEADDLDAVYARVTRANGHFVHPLREMPWGRRIFRVYDPDGYIVGVGEPMQNVVLRFLAGGMSAEGIAQRTGMPLGAVQQIVQTAAGRA